MRRVSIAPVGWPEGRKVAVWVVVNVEHYLPGIPGPAIQPHLSKGLDVANGGWRESGNRAGVRRLLAVTAELGVPVTAAVNGAICTERPDLIEAMMEHGWALMAHGLDNSTPHLGMARPAELERIRRTVDLLREATGQPVLGWLTPGFSVSEHTQELLVEAGLTYTADFGDDDVPYWLEFDTGRLLSLPYGLETNDISLLLSMHYTPRQFGEVVADHVAQMVADGEPGRVVAIGLHTFLVGQPSRLPHLRDCLERIAGMDGAWLTTADALVGHVLH